MGVSYKVAHWLIGIGHDAVHFSNESLHTLADSNIIEKAIIENRIILTADMDFGEILAFSKSSSVSVIQFRLFDLSPANIISKLNMVFNDFANTLDNDAVIVTVQQNKTRIKRLPI